jgi:hypothetical protein
LRLAPLAVLLAACGSEGVSPPPLGDYSSWYRLDTWGDVPGHHDTYRVIYANDVARTLGPTELDAILVKEVYDNAGGTPGALRHVSIMRKIRGGPSPEDEGGWLFTEAATAASPEVHYDLCWNRCHVQAPLAGVWLDYTAD